MKKNDIGKCASGMTVEILRDSDCSLVCCGEPVDILEAKTSGVGAEKHIPLLKEIAGGVVVVVGAVEHPMVEDHYIEWIEVVNGDYVNRKYLKPGDDPKATFYVPTQKGLVVRAYCNQHGLWRG